MVDADGVVDAEEEIDRDAGEEEDEDEEDVDCASDRSIDREY